MAPQKLTASRREWRDENLSRRVFVERHCQTAEELLDFLQPHRSDLLYGGSNQSWLFRGQSEALWGLTPRAMRHGELIGFTPGQLHTWDLTMEESMSREEDVAHAFNSWASNLGFEAPGDRPELRDKLERHVPRNRFGLRFPPITTRWFYALAQHHGVPTRLLDWTRRAPVAAYFAAISAARKESGKQPKFKNSDGRLAVWAFSEPYIHETLARSRAPAVGLVTAPTSSNPNLHAQSSVFTLVEFLKKPRKGSTWPLPDVDELLKKKRYRTEMLPSLVKFTLPHGNETRRLLHFLYLAQVHAATVFPGRDSVKATMLEGWYRTVTRPQISW